MRAQSAYRILGYVCGQLLHSQAEYEGADLAITLEQPVGQLQVAQIVPTTLRLMGESVFILCSEEFNQQNLKENRLLN